jgi:hypothetical protein
MKITRRQLRRLISEELNRVVIREGDAEMQAVKTIMQTPRLSWTGGERWGGAEGDIVSEESTSDMGSFQDTLMVAMMEGGGGYLESHQTMYVLEIRSDGNDVTVDIKFTGVDEDPRVTSSLEDAVSEMIEAWPDEMAALKATQPGMNYQLPQMPDGLELK